MPPDEVVERRATAAGDFSGDGLAAAGLGVRRAFAAGGERTAPFVFELCGAFDAATGLPARAFFDVRALRAARAPAARAALAFLLACFAAFLESFDALRAFFSSAFARRTCCLASSDRWTAFSASAFSRRSAALFARAAVERVLATIVAPHEFTGVELSPGQGFLSLRQGARSLSEYCAWPYLRLISLQPTGS
jgi:hypothetical protein